MAAHHKCIKYIEEILAFAKQYSGEYGWGCDWSKACQLGSCGFGRSAKNYLDEKCGLRFRKLAGYLEYCHELKTTTIDVAGKKRELHLDLSLPIEDDSLIGAFDFVISYATIEHVEDQYELFRNIHNLCKVGGVVIVNGSAMGAYEGHGTWRYDFWFFKRLFKACKYIPLDIRVSANKYCGAAGKHATVYASYIKVKDEVFIDRENFKFPNYDSIGHETDKKVYEKHRLKRSLEVGKFL